MSKNGTDYENLTQQLFQQLIDYDNKNYKKIDVKHDVLIIGKTGLKHQIDVYWEFELANVKYMTVVEVKDWTNKVKKSDIMSFQSKLCDIAGSPKGIFVSRNGFQEGAVTFAKYHGIKLLTITKTGLINHINFNFEIMSPHIDNFTIVIDKEWVQNEKSRLGISEPIKLKFSNNSILCNDEGELKPLINFISESQKRYSKIKDGEKATVSYHFKDKWYICTEDNRLPKVFIKGFEYELYYTSHNIEHEIHPDGLADYIMYDLIDGTQIGFNIVHGIVKYKNQGEYK